MPGDSYGWLGDVSIGIFTTTIVGVALPDSVGLCTHAAGESQTPSAGALSTQRQYNVFPYVASANSDAPLFSVNVPA